jgi:hypothetical protein
MLVMVNAKATPNEIKVRGEPKEPRRAGKPIIKMLENRAKKINAAKDSIGVKISWLLTRYWTTGVRGKSRRIKSPLETLHLNPVFSNFPPLLTIQIAIKIRQAARVNIEK